MQTDIRHCEREALGVVNDGEGVCPAKEIDSSYDVERVGASDRARNEDESEHQQSPCAVHVGKQAIQGEPEGNKKYLSKEVAENPRADKISLILYVIRRCGGVSRNDEFARHIRPKEYGERQRNKINRPSDASGFDGLVHLSKWVEPRCHGRFPTLLTYN